MIEQKSLNKIINVLNSIKKRPGMYVGDTNFEMIVHYIEGYFFCLYTLHEDIFSPIKFRELHKRALNISISEYFRNKYPEYDDMQLIELFVDMYITFIANNYEEANNTN